jgi:hypothetical protein
VVLTEAAVEGQGGRHCTAPCTAGEGSVDERFEGRNAGEDGEQVFGEGFDGGLGSNYMGIWSVAACLDP